jgi:hypothetical protein
VFGRGDLGRGDLGGGDLFADNPAEPGGELDFETAADLAKAPPHQFRACVIGSTCAATFTPHNRVRLDWMAPNVGGVADYEVRRLAGPDLTPAAVAMSVVVGNVDAVGGQEAYWLIDAAVLPHGQPFTYFARARYSDGTLSDPSNVVTIMAVNDPPLANDDSYGTNQQTALFIGSPGVLANDVDPDGGGPLSARLDSPPSHGVLRFQADGSFIYRPAFGFHGVDTFTYVALDGTSESGPATVTITVKRAGR